MQPLYLGLIVLICCSILLYIMEGVPTRPSSDYDQVLKKLEEMKQNIKLQVNEFKAAIKTNEDETRHYLQGGGTTNSPPPPPSKPSQPKFRPGEKPPRHVMFSTGRSGDLDPLQKIINRNSRLSVIALDRTQILYFDSNNQAIRKNAWGYPFLKDMYSLAMSVVPDADTYTYFNHDLIFNQSMLDTMDAVVLASRRGEISSRFLIVGKRTNVDWKEDMIVGETAELAKAWTGFASILKTGHLFQDDAQDYFVCSPNVWDWNSIPDFVVGRVAYDNWLVHKAVVGYPDIASIDATETSPILHQTGPSGNFQGHIGAEHANVKYNTILGKGEWYHGRMSNCKFKTGWDDNGNIKIIPR